MTPVNAIGGGLVVSGALAALSVFLWPADDSDEATAYVRRRTARHSRTGAAFSAVVTPIGAVLLLAASKWAWDALGLLIGGAAFYALQVYRVHVDWRKLKRKLEHEMETPVVPLDTLARIGTFPSTSRDPAIGLSLREYQQVGDAHAVVTARARLRWALAHPFGGRPPA